MRTENKFWVEKWLRSHAQTLGFSHIGIANIDLRSAKQGLEAWLHAGFAGQMHYMQRHADLRVHPERLVTGTKSIITARMNYLPSASPANWAEQELHRLQQPHQGVVSVYARGRDYHKVLRKRLHQLASDLNSAWLASQNPNTPNSSQAQPNHTAPEHTEHPKHPKLSPTALPAAFAWRAFSDSAPVLEVELAQKSGLAWRGKHTLALSQDAGSMFFLGELFCSLDLPPSEPLSAHCGTCNACMAVCPTQAIVAPRRLNAQRCISYLTIEHRGSIDPELRPLIGNRIYGCDDCQLVCPWNRFAKTSPLPDFATRTPFTEQSLLDCFLWSEATFLHYSQGSAIRRIGHAQWLRNVAIALGNWLRKNPDLATQQQICHVLYSQSQHPSPMVREHVSWALSQAKTS